MNELMFFVPHFVTEVLWLDDGDELVTVGDFQGNTMTMPLLPEMPMPTNFRIVTYLTWFDEVFFPQITHKGRINE
jgi:hypothetical protein